MAQCGSSNALANASISELISGFRSALRLRPSRGPNHIPLVISCEVRLIHLPSVHEPNSLLGALSLFEPLDESLPSICKKHTFILILYLIYRKIRRRSLIILLLQSSFIVVFIMLLKY